MATTTKRDDLPYNAVTDFFRSKFPKFKDKDEGDLIMFLGARFPKFREHVPQFGEAYKFVKRERKAIALAQQTAQLRDEQEEFAEGERGLHLLNRLEATEFGVAEQAGALMQSKLGSMLTFPFISVPGEISKMAGGPDFNVGRRTGKALREFAKGKKEEASEAAHGLGKQGLPAEFATIVGETAIGSMPSFVAAAFGGMPAAATTAGGQSYGAMWSEVYDEQRAMGKSDDQADREATKAATIAGVSTAALTMAFGGGERFIAKMFKSGAGKEMVSKGLKGIFTEIGKAALRDFPEEGIDEFIQGIVSDLFTKRDLLSDDPKVRGQAWKDVWKQAATAAFAGFFMAGGVTTAASGAKRASVGAERSANRKQTRAAGGQVLDEAKVVIESLNEYEGNPDLRSDVSDLRTKAEKIDSDIRNLIKQTVVMDDVGVKEAMDEIRSKSTQLADINVRLEEIVIGELDTPAVEAWQDPDARNLVRAVEKPEAMARKMQARSRGKPAVVNPPDLNVIDNPRLRTALEVAKQQLEVKRQAEPSPELDLQAIAIEKIRNGEVLTKEETDALLGTLNTPVVIEITDILTGAQKRREAKLADLRRRLSIAKTAQRLGVPGAVKTESPAELQRQIALFLKGKEFEAQDLAPQATEETTAETTEEAPAAEPTTEEATAPEPTTEEPQGPTAEEVERAQQIAAIEEEGLAVVPPKKRDLLQQEGLSASQAIAVLSGEMTAEEAADQVIKDFEERVSKRVTPAPDTGGTDHTQAVEAARVEAIQRIKDILSPPAALTEGSTPTSSPTPPPVPPASPAPAAAPAKAPSATKAKKPRKASKDKQETFNELQEQKTALLAALAELTTKPASDVESDVTAVTQQLLKVQEQQDKLKGVEKPVTETTDEATEPEIEVPETLTPQQELEVAVGMAKAMRRELAEAKAKLKKATDPQEIEDLKIAIRSEEKTIARTEAEADRLRKEIATEIIEEVDKSKAKPTPPPAAAGIALPQGVKTKLSKDVKEWTTTPVDDQLQVDQEHLLPNYQPGDVAKRVFGKRQGIFKLPVLGAILDPVTWRKIKKLPELLPAVRRWYFEHHGVAKSMRSAITAQFARADKVFKVNSKGDITNIKAEEGASLKISDVFESIMRGDDTYTLNPEQQAMFDGMAKVFEDGRRFAKAHNISRMSDNEGEGLIGDDFENYFIRVVTKRPTAREFAQGSGSKPGGKKPFEKRRGWKTEEEGWSKGYKYDTSIANRLGIFVEQLYKKAADVRLLTDPDLQGKTGQQLEADIRAYYASKPISEDELKRIIASVKEGQRVRGLSAPTETVGGEVIEQPLFFPDEIANGLDNEFNRSAGSVRKNIAIVNDAAKGLFLGMDFGVPMLQMQLLALSTKSSHRKAWLDGVKAMFKAFGSPEFMAGYLRDNAEIVRERVQLGGSIGGVAEMLAGLESHAALSRLSRNLAQRLDDLSRAATGVGAVGLKGASKIVGAPGWTMEAFARSFSGALTVASTELYKAARPFTNSSQLFDLELGVEGVLGGGRMESAGFTPGQALLTRVFTLAPSYYLGALNNISNFGGKGVSGDLSRHSLISMLTAGPALYFGFGLLFHTPDELWERMNPQRPDFMMWDIPVPGSSRKLKFGLGGIYRSLMRLFGNAYKVSKTNPGNFNSLSADRNPFSRWARGHASPTVSVAWTGINGKDFLGNETTPLEAIRNTTLPLPLQPLTVDREEHISVVAAELIASMWGFNAYPESFSNTRMRLRQEYSKGKYKKRYEDLSVSQLAVVSRLVEKDPRLEEVKDSELSLGFQEWILRAENERKTRVFKSLDPWARKLMDKHKVRPASFRPSFTVGSAKVRMTPEQATQMEELLIEEYNTRLNRMRVSLEKANTKWFKAKLDNVEKLAKSNAARRLKAAINRNARK